jgi:eukaryotic-like serine/threonine-protein kinase
MGEVYRARDSKLDRDVAVKVLPTHLDETADALARFEREAKAVAALSHPNILAIHDFGSHEGRAYAVMELLEGETLRERLRVGALPARKAAECAAQVARGLAAAHEKGIVHRDLKPENLFLTTDGHVKILDFGLARGATLRGDTSSPTVSRHTDPGTVLGTAGYMSPEQVRGKEADHRSDIFSLGCVLHEMLTGRRAFARDTAAETMTAILREDPPEVAESGVSAPPALERLVRHCLEKRPEDRFQSAKDVAFDLEAAAASTDRSSAKSLGPPAVRTGFRGLRLVGVAAGLAAGTAAGFWLGHRAGMARAPAAEPSFVRLTFGQGTVWSARFTPDGRTVAYSAAWDGDPIRLFAARSDNSESTPLQLPDAQLLSVSSTGELAVSLGHRYEGWMGAGTLARSPLLGGGARPVLEDVREADWTPDGSDLAIVRRVAGRERLEFPIGKVLYETGGYVSHIRFSPQGDRIAFCDHPIFADDFGYVAVVDRAGRKTTLTGRAQYSIRGIAWAPSGREVFFTASQDADERSLRAVDMSGRERLVLAGPTNLILFDVSRGGRVLLGRETDVHHVEALVSGAVRPRDFSVRQHSTSRNMLAGASGLLVTDQASAGYSVFLRPFDGSPPVRLGEGDGFGLSPDGRWALAVTPLRPRRILLHPTGPGQTRELPNPEGIRILYLRWLPDGRIVLFGAVEGHGQRGYVIDPKGGAPRAFTEEGVDPVRYWAIPVSPDGTRVVARDPQGRLAAFGVDGGASELIEGVSPLDVPLQWSADGRALFVARPGETPWRIRRHELVGGRETPVTEIQAAQPAGLRLSQIFITPDGHSWTHSYSQLLTDLYVADGLR